MIVEDEVLRDWNIYTAEEFHKEFNTANEWNGSETDEEYIMRHLQNDHRLFRVTFHESDRGDPYAEYWHIEEIWQ